MWRDSTASNSISEDRLVGGEPTDQQLLDPEPGGSWLATGFTLAALLAIGVLLASVRTAGALPRANEVAWDHYAPGTRSQIDQAYLGRDCEELQGWFISAAEADAQIRATNGSGALDLLAYVDQAINLAGCY